jgi:hypothetical protein
VAINFFLDLGDFDGLRINDTVDVLGYYAKISRVVLPLDVLNLCVLQGTVPLNTT